MEGNRHTVYDNDVKFENIKSKVNVTRESVLAPSTDGVVKGALLSGVPLTVTSNTPAATAHAMKKRCDYPVNNNDITGFKNGHDLVMAKVPQLPEFGVDQELFDEYLEHVGPDKAARLMAAMGGDDINLDGQNAMKNVFAKQEVLIKEHGSQGRIVYQATDTYNAIVGAVVYELQNRMQQVFSLDNPMNVGNTIIYAPGMSKTILGSIIDEAPGKVLESDFSSNDATQNGAWRKYEAMFYAKLGAPSWFVKEFAQQTSVNVWTRVGIQASIKGQRWSGEATTTVGNSYVGACQLQNAMSVANVVKSVNIHGGDDYLGVIDVDSDESMTEVRESVESEVKKTGMIAKAILPASKTHATFYQTRFPRDNVRGSRVPVPRFGRTLAKINVRANANKEVGDREYMAGKYLSAAFEYRYVPRIRDMLAKTSSRLSSQPYVDPSTMKGLENVDSVDALRKFLASVTPMSVEDAQSYTEEVYGLDFEAICEVFKKICDSTIEYCDGWTIVDQTTKKSRNKKNNWEFLPVYIGGDTVEVLVRIDT